MIHPGDWNPDLTVGWRTDSPANPVPAMPEEHLTALVIEAFAMKHVHDLWFERIVRRSSSRDHLDISHVLIVVTDLLTDLDITDIDALDYLESEL